MMSRKYVNLHTTRCKALGHFENVYVHSTGVFAACLAQGTPMNCNYCDVHINV
jgi:hypothetical protein